MTKDSMEPKKLALLRILEIFQRYSDENHHLKQEDIIAYLERDYGLIVERKAVGRNISLLKESGIEIESDKRGSYLAKRVLDPVELRILIDSVLSSRFLSVEKSKALIDKLCSMTSIYFKSNIRHIHAVNEYNKTDAPELFRNIELICDAIERHKKIRMMRLSIGLNKKMDIKHPETVCTPCAIFISKQEYYLLVVRNIFEDEPESDPEYRLSIWAVRKLSVIEIVEDSKAINLQEVERFKYGVDIPKLISEYAVGTAVRGNFFWKGNEPERFTILCSSGVIDSAIDTFGEDIRVMKAPEIDFSILKDNMYGLMYGYGMRSKPQWVTISVLAEKFAVFEFLLRLRGLAVLLSPEKARNTFIHQLREYLTFQEKMLEAIGNKK